MKVILFFFIFLNSTYALTAKVANCNSSLRVRKNSSITSKVVGKLDCLKKTSVQVVGVEGEWISILYFQDIRYVHKDYIEYLPEYSISNVEGAIVKGIAKNCKSWVNIRSGPGEKFPVLGGLHCENQINVLGKNEDWFVVRYEKKTGFIYKEKLKILHN